MTELQDRIAKYLELEKHPDFTEEIRHLVKENNEEKLSEVLSEHMKFGTGGIRGKIGGGYKRMNTYTVGKVTQGLANYIRKHVPASARKVALSYDSRHYSELFCHEACRVLAANGIESWHFPALGPTPLLSFALRKIGACAGIMITASHNPPDYNGYKVYWSDGAQVVKPQDGGIMSECARVEDEIQLVDYNEARRNGLIKIFDSDIDAAYERMVLSCLLNRKLFQEKASILKVVYSPLHGAGMKRVESILKSLNVNLVTVPEQREPDGNFPTVKVPNPEAPEALSMARELAEKTDAHIVMATDPDADRVGVLCPGPGAGEWTQLTGNQHGALLVDYIFRCMKEQNRLPVGPVFVNTIVSSRLQNLIAESCGAKSYRVLTGFKYIGEKIRELESDGGQSFVFGCEESCGYLFGTDVRDKDGVQAVALTAGMCLWNLARGKTMLEHLDEIWQRFGYWEESLKGYEFDSTGGQEMIRRIMDKLRSAPPQRIASFDVSCIRDYQSSLSRKAGQNQPEKDIDLPRSDVMQFFLGDRGVLTARPSGTEPKIKFYFSLNSGDADDLSEAREGIARSVKEVLDWIDDFVASLNQAG